MCLCVCGGGEGCDRLLPPQGPHMSRGVGPKATARGSRKAVITAASSVSAHHIRYLEGGGGGGVKAVIVAGVRAGPREGVMLQV